MEAALKQSKAWGFIQELENGIDTYCGKEGT